MNRKGISPMIATILMIAVTMSMAAIITGWAPDLIQSLTEETGEQADDIIDCGQAGVSVEEVAADDGADPSEMDIAIQNTGDTELNVTVTAFDDDDFPLGEAEDPLGGELVSSGSYEDMTVDEDDFDDISGDDIEDTESIQVQSVQCPTEAVSEYHGIEWD